MCKKPGKKENKSNTRQTRLRKAHVRYDAVKKTKNNCEQRQEHCLRGNIYFPNSETPNMSKFAAAVYL